MSCHLGHQERAPRAFPHSPRHQGPTQQELCSSPRFLGMQRPRAPSWPKCWTNLSPVLLMKAKNISCSQNFSQNKSAPLSDLLDTSGEGVESPGSTIGHCSQATGSGQSPGRQTHHKEPGKSKPQSFRAGTNQPELSHPAPWGLASVGRLLQGCPGQGAIPGSRAALLQLPSPIQGSVQPGQRLPTPPHRSSH